MHRIQDIFRQMLRGCLSAKPWPYLLALAFISLSVWASIIKATQFNGSQIDGVFQVYNPLRRVAAGQIPGVDFQSFHGIGVPLTYFPIFALFGKGLFGCLVTMWVTCLILVFAAICLFIRVSTQNTRRAVFWSVIVLGVSWITASASVTPGNSSLALRSLGGLVVGAVAVVVYRNRGGGRLSSGPRGLILGVAAGLTFPFGTEFCLALLPAVAVSLLIYEKGSWAKLIASSLAIVGWGVGSVVAVSLLTLGRPARALKYALIDIPEYQGFYFGAPPAGFLSPKELLIQFTTLPVLCYLVATIIAVVTLSLGRRLGVIDREQALGSTILVLQGIFSLGSVIGYLNLDYQGSVLFRNSLIVFGSWMSLVWSRFTKPPVLLQSGGLPSVFRKKSVAAVVSVLPLLVAMSFTTTVFDGIDGSQRGVGLFQASDRELLVEEAAEDYDQIGRLLRGHSGEFWSLYSGEAEAQFGVFNPSSDGFDYAIHALGKDYFHRYSANFKAASPRYVISTSLRHSAKWERWLRTRIPKVYSILFHEYHIVLDTGVHLVWERNESGRNPASNWTPVSNDGFFMYRATSGAGGVAELRFDYDAGCEIRGLSRFERFLISVDGSTLEVPISVRPGKGVGSVVVGVRADSTLELIPSAEGMIPGCHLKLSRVELRDIDVSRETRAVA